MRQLQQGDGMLISICRCISPHISRNIRVFVIGNQNPGSRGLERTMTAVGVARPTAQGQAITRVEMPNSSANRKGLLSVGRQSAGYAPVSPAHHTVQGSRAFGVQMTSGFGGHV